MMRDLEARLGHAFIDKGVIEEALTHSSYANECGGTCNERLEFLGDAVLEMFVSEALFKAHPDWDEGTLTNERSLIVRESSLAQWASFISIDRELRISKGMEIQGGRRSASILADAMEAVIGALFIDGGVETAKDFVVRMLRDAPAPTDAREHAPSHGSSDPKSRLQEMLQARGELPPVYSLLRRTGPDHASTFLVSLSAMRGAVESTGSGHSKKEAEFEAARKAIELLSSASSR